MSDRRELTCKFVKTCERIRIDRIEYQTLFEHSDKRIELLSEVAQVFFARIQEIFIEYILLQYCKLTDPARMATKNETRDNLTTNGILSLGWSEKTKQIMIEKNIIMQEFTGKIRTARNRIIGHFDQKTIVYSQPLGEFEESEEWSFWKALNAFVNAAHTEEYGRPIEIINIPGCHGDAGDLIGALVDAVDYSDIVRDPEEKGFLQRRFLKRRYQGE